MNLKEIGFLNDDVLIWCSSFCYVSAMSYIDTEQQFVNEIACVII